MLAHRQTMVLKKELRVVYTVSRRERERERERQRETERLSLT